MDAPVAFVGLGNAGLPMAEQIARSGATLAVFDLRPERADTVSALGATVASSCMEAAKLAEIIGVNVANEDQLDDVIFGNGDDGLLAGCAEGAVIYVHSTVHPDACRRIAAAAAQVGVGFVDAGFSGGAEGAANATLTLMLGGSAPDVQRCDPVFATYAARRLHLGEVGAGMLAKIINNVVVHDSKQVLAEALRLAARSGVDPDAMLDIITASTGDSWVARHWGLLWRQEGYESGPEAQRALADKDLRLSLELGQRVAADMPVTALVSQLTSQWYRDLAQSAADS